MHEDSNGSLADTMMEAARKDSYFDQLPPDSELKKGGLTRKERIEWTDCKIRLLVLSNAVRFVETGEAKKHTHNEISKVSGISKERSRQIEQEAILKLFRKNQKDLEELREEMFKLGLDSEGSSDTRNADGKKDVHTWQG